MDYLQNSFSSRLCKLYISNFYFVSTIITIIITFLALFQMLPPRLLTITMPIETVVYDQSHPSSTTEQILFTHFGPIRRTISEIISMVASSHSLERKIDFLDISNNFLQERLQNLIQTSEQFQQDLEDFFHVQHSFTALKTNVNNNNKTKNGNLFAKHLQNYLTEVGNWRQKLTKKYEEIMATQIKECSRKMKTLEEKISRLIYETQHGNLCEMNKTLLLFRETAA